MKISKNFFWALISVSPFIFSLFLFLVDILLALIFGTPSLNAEPIAFFEIIGLGIYFLLPNLGVLVLIVASIFTSMAWKEKKSNIEKRILIFYSILLLTVAGYEFWWFVTKQELIFP